MTDGKTAKVKMGRLLVENKVSVKETDKRADEIIQELIPKDDKTLSK